MKRSSFKPDRKPFVKSFLLRRHVAASRRTGNYIIYTLSPVGQSTTLRAEGPVKPKNPTAVRPVNLENPSH